MDETAVLLELLNSTPVIDGRGQDRLRPDTAAGEWARGHGGTGSAAEAEQLRATRDRLQAVLRGEAAPATLAPGLRGARQVPELTDTGLTWHLEVDDDRRLAVRAVLAWARLAGELPGRLRPCENPDCRLFLLDRSRANTGRWCSMQVCGNRMKARRHYRRARAE